MTRYNIHIYREMRLFLENIEANTPEAAAFIARDKPTEDAGAVEDCEGETLAALVDVIGDEDFRGSVTIDFEAERQRKAAAKLLAALQDIVVYQDFEKESFLQLHEKHGITPSIAGEKLLARLLDNARDCIAEANAAGIASAPADIDVHAPLAARRQIALVWSVEDVRAVAPALTDDQCWEVLQQAERRHDAEIGINWTVLTCHVETLLGEAEGTDAAEGA